MLILGHCYKGPMQTIWSTILLFGCRHRPVISLEPAQKPKRIATIDQWLTAFQTLVAIYTVRFPHIVPALMKHSETVRDLAAKNAHWHYYDENFHFLRHKKHFSLGTKFMGNCGCRCTTWTEQPQQFPWNRPTKILGSPFRPVSAGNFTRGISVQDATSSTNVSNVGIGIQRASVHFPADSNQIRQKLCPDRREHSHLTNPLLHPTTRTKKLFNSS